MKKTEVIIALLLFFVIISFLFFFYLHYINDLFLFFFLSFFYSSLFFCSLLYTLHNCLFLIVSGGIHHYSPHTYYIYKESLRLVRHSSFTVKVTNLFSFPVINFFFFFTILFKVVLSHLFTFFFLGPSSGHTFIFALTRFFFYEYIICIMVIASFYFFLYDGRGLEVSRSSLTELGIIALKNNFTSYHNNCKPKTTNLLPLYSRSISTVSQLSHQRYDLPAVE